MKGNILCILGILLLFSITTATALDVSPTKISKIVEEGQIEFYEVTISNPENYTESLTISSTDTSVVVTGVSHVDIPAGEEVKFMVILRGKGLAYLRISNSEDINIPVEVSTGAAEEEGYLEPTFTKYKKSFEEGVTSKMRLSLRNHYPQSIEIRDALMENVVTTHSGVSKPIGVEGQMGFITAGGDLTLDITIDTVDLDPGVYMPELYIIYYYKEARYERKIDFEITVIEKLTPAGDVEEEKLKGLAILFTPENPKIGDNVAVNIVDSKSREVLSATIRVTEKDIKTGEKKITYILSQPILVNIAEYCVNATLEGYASKTRCFQSALLTGKIKINPEPRVNQIAVVSFTDLFGNVVDGATLTIDDLPYSAQASVTFTEGKHRIIGKAEGYVDVTRTIKLTNPFSYEVEALPTDVGDDIVISFNQPTTWYIGEEVKGNIDSDTSSKIKYTIDEAGDYYVVVNDKIISEFTVESTSWLPSLPTTSVPWWIGVAIILLGIGFIQYRKSKKSTTKVGYGLGGGSRTKPHALEEIEEEE